MRKQSCPACNALKHGVVTRRALEHIGCEFDRHTYYLPGGGSATFTGAPPSKEQISALNEMVELAKKNIKKGKL